MARKFLVPIDLTQQELQNARIQNLASAPSSPVAGQIYYNTSSNTFLYYNGSAWVTPSSTQITVGLLSARPLATAVVAGSFYYATDNQLMYESNATVWAQVSNFGTGVSSANTVAQASADGTSTNYARADHAHAGEGFAAPTATTTYGLSAVTGTATTLPHSDHTHGTPALTAVNPTAITIAGTVAVGTGTAPAREDHAHAGPGFAASTATTTYGLSAVTGTATTTAHSDHTHGTPSLSGTAAGAVTTSTGTAGAVGTASDSGHTHGLTASGFAISAFGSPTTDVAWASHKITGLLDPTAAQDAATKAYVDSIAQGLNVHDGVEAATTANLAYTYVAGSAGADGGTGVGATLTNPSIGIITIDGHATILGDRILFKNQTTALQNGIYVVTTVGTAGVAGIFTRTTDYDNHIAGQVMAGDFVFIALGTTQSATTWVQINTGTSTTPINGIKLGTDSLAFTQFGAGATYTAGNGITLAGSAFSFAPLSTGGLTVGGTGATAAILLPTNSGLGTSGTGLAVGAGTGITVTTGTVNIDTTVVARKFSQTLSTSSTSYTVTHNLGTLDVHVQVYLISDGSEVSVDNLRATTNTVTINFSVAPTSSAYRVVVIG